MKQWYMICIGYDIGDAESGPMFRTEYDCLKAKSLETAKARAEKFIHKNYPEGCEGYSVYLAKSDEDFEMLAHLIGWSKETALMDRAFEALPFN